MRMFNLSMSRRSPVVGLAALTVLAACGGDKGDAMARDSALARDLQMAQPAAGQPALTDTAAQAAAPAPAAAPTAGAKAPAPRPAAAAAPASRGRTLPGNTRIVLASAATVCTNTSKVGDTFAATVFEPVNAGGVTVPAGTRVTLELTRLERKTGANNEVVMDVAARSMAIGGSTVRFDGASVSPDITKIRAESKSADVQKVAAGAAIGAAAGALLGKNAKSAAIGAAAGTAAGVGAAAAMSNYEGCINENNKIVLVTGGAMRLP
jgi:hypothetical protein